MSEADKSLRNKAVKIKGKDYVQVADRILYFNEKYPKGSIQTELVSEPTADLVIVKATVAPRDDDSTLLSRCFTGYSQAKWGDGMVNKTAALENAETSAVGRALAMMGIGVIESVASSDEIHKASTGYTQPKPYVPPKKTEDLPGPSENQKERIRELGKKAGIDPELVEARIDQLETPKDALQAIATLTGKVKEQEG